MKQLSKDSPTMARINANDQKLLANAVVNEAKKPIALQITRAGSRP